MKRRSKSVKWKMFIYLLLFVLIIITLLWFVQTVSLSKFYEMSRINGIRMSANYIIAQIDSPELDKVLEGLSMRDDLSIYVMDEKGVILHQTEKFRDWALRSMQSQEITEVLAEVQNNGTALRRYSQKFPKMESSPLQEAQRPRKDALGMESIVYATSAQTQAGENRYILLGTTITPIDSTVTVLRSQLVYVTLFLIGAAAVLAWLMSRRIAKPIIDINESAKELTRRHYNVTFDTEGYREIDELSNTLNEAARELDKTERLRQELIANVSHDLRTPLTMIIGYSEVMRDLPGENSPENVQIIIDEANRLTRLVDDLLDISKLESGTEQMNLTCFNLTEAVHNTVGRCARLVEREGYRIEFLHEQDAWVEGDELKISQVIYNLIGNALTHPGEDHAVAVRQEINDGMVRISVEDSGEGIPPGQLGDIWQRYYKIDKTHRRARVGTGLGLSIVKGIVERHGGTCGVESVLGQGSTFWFQLQCSWNQPFMPRQNSDSF